MQNIYDVRQKGKLIFLLISVLLVGGVLYVSNDLVDDLSVEERKKMEIWAEATRELASDKTEMSMELILKVIQSNTSIPAILVDENFKTSVDGIYAVGDAISILNRVTDEKQSIF